VTFFLKFNRVLSPRDDLGKTEEEDIERVSNEHLKCTREYEDPEILRLARSCFRQSRNYLSSLFAYSTDDVLVMQNERNSTENSVNLRKSFPQFYLKNTCVIEKQSIAFISEKRDRLFFLKAIFSRK